MLSHERRTDNVSVRACGVKTKGVAREKSPKVKMDYVFGRVRQKVDVSIGDSL